MRCFWMLALLVGCGDLADPDFEAVEVQLDGETVQTLEISTTGKNVFDEYVDPESVLVLKYDEPLDLSTVKDHVYIEDESGTELEATIEMKLSDIFITPDEPMEVGNHTLVAEDGIDDMSKNTTEVTFKITFYVE
ncbi:MAG: hypothetical protein HN348_21470 [Proteobacteria bacterium]|nr:hypothetical protein [Pseudomonadota bacterium]